MRPDAPADDPHRPPTISDGSLMTMAVTPMMIAKPALVLNRAKRAYRQQCGLMIATPDARTAQDVADLLAMPVRSASDDCITLYNAPSPVKRADGTRPVIPGDRPASWVIENHDRQLRVGDEVIASGPVNADPTTITADLPSVEPDAIDVTDKQLVLTPVDVTRIQYCDITTVLSIDGQSVTQHTPQLSWTGTNKKMPKIEAALRWVIDHWTAPAEGETIAMDAFMTEVQQWYRGVTTEQPPARNLIEMCLPSTVDIARQDTDEGAERVIVDRRWRLPTSPSTPEEG